MTTQLTNEQIDKVIAARNASIARNEKTRQLIDSNDVILRASIAELEAQRPKDLYVVLDRDGDLYTSTPIPLIDALDRLRRANTNGSFAPCTLCKLTPCNPDGSVLS